MALHNEVIERPRAFKGEHFTGKTVLAFDGRWNPERNSFDENCTFDGGGRGAGNYALYTPARFAPRTMFLGSHFTNAEKLVRAHHVALIGCDLGHAQDAVFHEVTGPGLLKKCIFHDLGGMEGDHADGDQAAWAEGTWIVEDCEFRLRDKPKLGQFTNSCGIQKTQLGPIGTTIYRRCLFEGGQYAIFSIESNYGAPTVIIEDCVAEGQHSKYPVMWNTAKAKPFMHGNNWPSTPPWMQE